MNRERSSGSGASKLRNFDILPSVTKERGFLPSRRSRDGGGFLLLPPLVQGSVGRRSLAYPALRMLKAPTRSAFSEKPHSTQANCACLLRFFGISGSHCRTTKSRGKLGPRGSSGFAKYTAMETRFGPISATRVLPIFFKGQIVAKLEIFANEFRRLCAVY